MYYFIIDGRNNILHPTRRTKMIHYWIKSGRARFIGKNLVRIFKHFNKAKTISCKFIVGVDPGYKNIGFSISKIYKSQIINILNGEVTTRTSEITKLLQERSMYRRARRSKHRENILRKFSKAKFKVPRWKNRHKKPWTPSHQHLVNSHLNILNYIFRRINLEESEIAIEYFKFDSQKYLNSNIKSYQYQKGPQFGYENLKAYIRARDNYTCQICKHKLTDLRVHHILERSKGGTDRVDNLITLCESCHNKVHSNKAVCPKVSTVTPMRDSGVLNSCMKYLVNLVAPLYTITGADTSALRHYYNLEKSHSTDAKMVTLANPNTIGYTYQDSNNNICMNQYRRHTRNWVARYEDRKYYSDGFLVAWNRNARSTQSKTKPSLAEFRQEFPKEQVTVKPGRTIYFRSNTLAKYRPGDIFKYQGVVHVLKGWESTHGYINSIDNIKFKIKDCTKIKNRSGLVVT